MKKVKMLSTQTGVIFEVDEKDLADLGADVAGGLLEVVYPKYFKVIEFDECGDAENGPMVSEYVADILTADSLEEAKMQVGENSNVVEITEGEYNEHAAFFAYFDRCCGGE